MTNRKLPWRVSRRHALQLGTAVVGASAYATLWRPKHLLAADPAYGGTLRISVNVRMTTLNPFRQGNNPEYMMGELMYAGLTRLGPDMAPQPDLAESWQANDDASEFVFTLKPGLTFHHGPPVTAADVVASVKTVLDPETGSPGQQNIGPITAVEALDERRVRFALDGPFASFPVTLATPSAKVAPAAIIEEDVSRLEQEDFGCGPFQLASYDPGRATRVERFDGYHVDGLPYLDAVEQILYPDLAAETAALINGETDLMLQVNPADVPRLEAAPGIVVRRQQTGRYLNLVMRTDQEPFDDVRVRQALAKALDREALVELVLEGYGRAAHDNVISPEYQFHAETPQVEMDIEGARQLLAEAGYPNGVDVTLLCSTRPPLRTQLGVAVKELAKPAGFNIDVQTVPHDNYIANVWKQAPFYVGNWNMRPTEDSMYTLLLTTDAPWADTAWNNEAFDALVFEARRTTDEARRAELYAEAQRMAVEEVPYIVPFYLDVLSAHADYVMDYVMHPLQVYYQIDRVWLGEDAPTRG